jgi:hypothetical protein
MLWHLSRVQAEIPLIPAVQISRASSYERGICAIERVIDLAAVGCAVTQHRKQEFRKYYIAVQIEKLTIQPKAR